METTTKTPFKKHIDKRYISGEDLKNGVEMNKGLKPEIVVTMASFKDVKAYNQKQGEEVDKTAIWLKEYPSGKMLYKPVILNVSNADFLISEIAGGSLFLEDADLTKPFVLYAKSDKRFTWVARFKKYFAPPTITPDRALGILNNCNTLEELTTAYKELLSREEALLPQVIAKKDSLKLKFSKP